MRETRVRRRIVAAGAIVGCVVAGQLVGVQHAAAASAKDCTGQYSIQIPDSLSMVTALPSSDSWVRTCASVDTAATPPIWGDVTVNPDTNSNSFVYTGNCVEGTISFSDGGFGVFIAGVVVIVNPGLQQQFTAVTAPSGAACLATSSTTLRTWSGVSNFVIA
jgi:hypothetical protein